MASNLAIDEKLLNAAYIAGGFKSKKDTVNAALKCLLKAQKKQALINMAGTIDFDEDYDYKKERSREQNID